MYEKYVLCSSPQDTVWFYIQFGVSESLSAHSKKIGRYVHRRKIKYMLVVCVKYFFQLKLRHVFVVTYVFCQLGLYLPT